MGTCINCGRENLATETLAFYTARIASQQTEWVSYKRQLTTTRYTDFRHHSYQVCRRCTLNKRWLPIIGSILFFFILLVPMAMMNRAGVPSTISTPIVFVVVTAAVIGAVAFRRAWKPTRLALAGRKAVDPKSKYTILSLKEYAGLTGNRMP